MTAILDSLRAQRRLFPRATELAIDADRFGRLLDVLPDPAIVADALWNYRWPIERFAGWSAMRTTVRFDGVPLTIVFER